MTLSFKYKSIKRPDGTLVKSPSIPIILKGKEQFETAALIDSGADISAIPKDIAEIFGCDLSGKIEPAAGVWRQSGLCPVQGEYHPGKRT
jgi:hypothetical protein